MGGTFNFASDLKHAREVENRLAAILLERGKVQKVETNDDNRFDLLATFADGSQKTIEVKHDMVSERSGNIGVEFRCRGKWSGIETTEADFWAFCVSNEFWMIQTEKLRQLIDSVGFIAVGRGGDPDSRTAMYLFESDFLKKYMTYLGLLYDGWTWDEIGSNRRF